MKDKTKTVGLPKEEIDVSQEDERIYEYSVGSTITIRRPVTLVVMEDSHSIVDEFGVGHWMTLKNLRRIILKPKEGTFKFICHAKKDELLMEEQE